jgi:hypothetical protein
MGAARRWSRWWLVPLLALVLLVPVGVARSDPPLSHASICSLTSAGRAWWEVQITEQLDSGNLRSSVSCVSLLRYLWRSFSWLCSLLTERPPSVNRL